VVVGATEPTLGDQHLVPVDRSGSTSGVIVIANAINTIVSNGYLDEPAQGLEILLVIGLGLVTALLFALWRLSLAARSRCR
jgi:CHASE2 domain-containing sensor protein